MRSGMCARPVIGIGERRMIGSPSSGRVLTLFGLRSCIGSIFRCGLRSNSRKSEVHSLFSSLFAALGVNRWACLASFLLLCLHPIGFQENDYTMSDTFYVAMLWYVLGGLLLTLATRSWWSAAGTGLAIAILWNTREEGILLTALLGLWLAIFCLWKKSASAKPIAITSGTAIILIALVYAANDRVFRSFARSEMTAPAFQTLYHSLLRINPAESKPYAPITMETLHRAFASQPDVRASCAHRLTARSAKPGGSRRCGEPARLTRSVSAGLSGRRARPPAHRESLPRPRLRGVFSLERLEKSMPPATMVGFRPVLSSMVSSILSCRAAVFAGCPLRPDEWPPGSSRSGRSNHSRTIPS